MVLQHYQTNWAFYYGFVGGIKLELEIILNYLLGIRL